MAAGDGVPGSSATFGAPHSIVGLSDSGDLTFTAATSSSLDGLFVGNSGGGIQTIALNGDAAPGGGTLALTTPYPGLALADFLSGSLVSSRFTVTNNFAASDGQSDVVFRAGITGGSADSGYFRTMRSGPAAGILKAVALQGQLVSGAGALSTIPPPGPIFLVSNTVVSFGANFALGPDGAFAFLNYFTDDTGAKPGMFVARTDGTIVKALAGGDIAPGGGVVSGLSISQRLAAGNPGEFAFSATIQGGDARQAIFVTAVPPGTAVTTTVLGSSQSSAVFGQPVQLTATVSSTASGSSSGKVSFYDNGVLLGAGTLSNGQAVLQAPTLSVGSHSIVGQYSGDANFASSNSVAMPQTVTARTTTTALASSLSSIVGGQSVTFTASVTTPTSGAPTGTVTFLDNGVSIGTGTLNGAAVATLNTAALTVAPHTITARYEGDAGSLTSTSSTLTETVNAVGFASAPSNLTVTAGQSVAISLTLYQAPGANMSFTLGCSGLPIGSACAFGSNPVIPMTPPTGTTVQVTFSTAAGSASLPSGSRKGPWPFGTLGFISVLSALAIAATFMMRQKPRAHRLAACGLMIIALALAIAGCNTQNSGSPGTPKGAAAFVVTGTSGPTTVSTVVTVTVR